MEFFTKYEYEYIKEYKNKKAFFSTKNMEFFYQCITKYYIIEQEWLKMIVESH